MKNKIDPMSLFTMIEERDFSLFRKSIVDFKNKMIVDDEGRTLLHWAASQEMNNCAELLVSLGVDIGVEDHKLWTPLAVACSNGDIEQTKLFVSHGANVNGLRAERRPLILAAQSGRREVVAYLLSQGANIEILDEAGESALIHASREGRIFTVQTLLGFGALMEVHPGEKRQALHWAIQENHLTIVELLLSWGANVEVLDEGISPIAQASSAGYLRIVQALISAGALVENPNGNQSAIINSVLWNELDVMGYLIKNGANANSVDKEGNNLFMLCVNDDNFKGASELMILGADPNMKNKAGISAIDKINGMKNKKKWLSIL